MCANGAEQVFRHPPTLLSLEGVKEEGGGDPKKGGVFALIFFCIDESKCIILVYSVCFEKWNAQFTSKQFLNLWNTF